MKSTLRARKTAGPGHGEHAARVEYYRAMGATLQAQYDRARADLSDLRRRRRLIQSNMRRAQSLGAL